jgi:hypothetical protein
VSVDERVAGPVAGRPDAAARRRSVRGSLATAVVWLLGSAVVAAAQPGTDRRLAAAVSAVAAVAVILVVSRLTADPGRRYFRSVVGAIVTVSLTAGWLLRRLPVIAGSFGAGGLVERIALPLLVVLLAPLVVSALPPDLTHPGALWRRRATLRRSARPLDWIVGAYITVVMVPALLVGLAHHDRLSYVGQDVGLIVVLSFMYLAGRAVDAETGRAGAEELVGLLLLLGAAQFLLLGWQPAPLYSYIEAACAGAIAVAILRPQIIRWLPLGLAVTLLLSDVVAVVKSSHTQTSVAVELCGALVVLGYLAVRLRRLVPQWLIIAAAAVALVAFVGFTQDGVVLRGQYHGEDQSNLGRTYEAHQVRAAIRQSPLSLPFGRGLGSTIDETHASPVFKQVLLSGGRDLAHVQQIHLLGYSTLLKTGLLGLAWLAAFAIGLAAVALRGLERAAREREPELVIYVALPLLGFMQAQGATSHLAANPLNALALGILVTFVGAKASSRNAAA